MEHFTLFTRDAKGKYWPITDATAIIFTTKETGFDNCQFTLAREFAVAWDDISLNMQVFVYNARGDVAWYGRLENITPTITPNVKITAVGYWYSAYDLTTNGTISGATPEACLKSLLSTTYLPQLSTTQTGIYTTGITGYSYNTPNAGTDDLRVGDIILALCKVGDSSNNRVIPAVWGTLGADGKPLLTTKALSYSVPAPRYILHRNGLKGLSLSRSLSLVRDRVIARYKSSSNGALARSTQNDTSTQAELGIDFTGGGTVTNYIRTEMMDISGFTTGTTSAIADATATARLNEVSRLRNVANQALTVSQEYSVFDTVANQELPLWSVRAGNFVRVPDLFPRASEAGTGTAAGDYSLATVFYITQTSYNVQNATLSITPEQSSAASEVMSK